MTAESPIQLGLVGIGKIARDQHLPAIAFTPAFRLVAAASRHSSVDGANMYPTVEEMLAGEPDVAAVALCMPPQERHAAALAALRAGRHVLLEKPPGATLAEVEDLRLLAERRGVSLFATWHARFAPTVEPARAWIAERRVTRVRIDWREDVRHWHPGQAWIWEAGGLGVFDPGINALSIATRILPQPFFLTSAELHFPENRDAPIAADLVFTDDHALDISATFDWLQTGPQTWDIRVETDRGVLVLHKGGSILEIDGQVVSDEPEQEYRGIYARFAELIATRQSDVDVSPLRHAADAFLRGKRIQVARFDD